jgi:cysteine synthase
MKNLSLERTALYNHILGSVKNSPIKTIEFEGNIYHFKLDYMLPYGECHYSRVFAKLIYLKECLGIIKPGDILLETTSGSGGRAAAAIATALGYKIKVAIPAGGERARERAIEEAGGELYLTPAEAYVNGFPDFIKGFLAEHPEVKYLNHVMGDITGRGATINGAAVNAFNAFVEEVVEFGISPDMVICPLGNGTTTLPIATGFKSLFRKTQIVGFEAVSSALAYRKKFPGKYERVFGIDPETIPRHDLPGTTPAKAVFPHPALDAGILNLDYIALVTSNHINNCFMKTVGFKPSDKSEHVIKWDDFNHEASSEFGRTGKAGFAVAVAIARKQGFVAKHILVPVFDAAWHYDS